MDSSGLRVLVTAHARAGVGGPQFAIVRPLAGGEVAKILNIAGVEQQLNVVEEP
jgi:anti-anti-sigma regulatory factor